jgi:hypothetical protein
LDHRLLGVDEFFGLKRSFFNAARLFESTKSYGDIVSRYLDRKRVESERERESDVPRHGARRSRRDHTELHEEQSR